MGKTLKLLFKRKIVLVSAVVVVLFVLIALFAKTVVPYDPNEADLHNALEQPNLKHLLGTDNFGRDILTRLVYGSRVSLLVGVLAVCMAAMLGLLLGLVSGFFGGIIDSVIMRVCEMLLSIPQIILALALGAVIGGGLFNLTILLGISAIPGYIRIIRSQVLSIKQMDYIMAQKIIGSGNARIIFRHVLHNSISPMIVMMTQTVGYTILAEAGLSFLGLGVNPPTASWGGMINDGKSYLTAVPILAISPGICVMTLVMSLNFVGDGLRDVLDPRLRGTI